VVTTLSGWKNSFFLQDKTNAISVDRSDTADIRSGDEVEVTGVTGPGLFAPVLIASRVERLGPGRIPPAQRVSYAELISGDADSERVQIEGVVHAATVGEIWGRRVLSLTLHVQGNPLTVRVLNFPENGFERLVDAEVIFD
jgi:hypothetical protein